MVLNHSALLMYAVYNTDGCYGLQSYNAGENTTCMCKEMHGYSFLKERV